MKDMVTKRKILDVDKEALLRGYSYSAEMMAVVSPAVRFDGVDCTISDLLFMDEDGLHKEYICRENSEAIATLPVEIVDTEGIIQITTYDNETGKKTDAFLYETAEGHMKSCQFKNLGFKQNHKWSFSGICMVSKTEECEKEFRIGFVSNNKLGVVHIDTKNNVNSYKDFDNVFGYQYVKLELQGGMIKGFFSVDGIEWVQFWTEENMIPNCNRRMGFLSWTGDECFKNWFFTNHIQIHFAEGLQNLYDVKLDYYVGLQCFARHQSFNPWIKADYINSVFFQGEKIFDRMKSMIDSGYYVAVLLNEKYVKNRLAYNRTDHKHENMIYGYDLTNQKVYLCGFDEHQKFSFDEISIDELEKAYAEVDGTFDWCLTKFEVQQYVYELNRNTIINMLVEYRDGINSAKREELKINDAVRLFGLKVYDELKKNQYQVRDVRVPYIIYEHKKLMTERIKYFYQRRLLREEDMRQLLIQSQNMERMTRRLMLLGIKDSIKEDNMSDEKIDILLGELSSAERIFIDAFIKALKCNA